MTPQQLVEVISKIAMFQAERHDQPFGISMEPYAPFANGEFKGQRAIELDFYGTCSDGEWGLVTGWTIDPNGESR